MKLWVGTSGFSYKEWKGRFYPEDLPDREMLSYYSRCLPAVEINNTFYRLPRAEMLQTWSEQTPETFRFVLKASQRITHKKRLKEAEDETHYLFETAQGLGERLGVIFFQLPPYLRKDVARLEAFLQILPEPRRAAFEFRHESWFDQEVYDCLAAHGSALCLADTEKNDAPELVATSDWGYLRLRREAYDDAELTAWVERVKGQNWRAAYVFFKHEDESAGPKLAQRFLELAQ